MRVLVFTVDLDRDCNTAVPGERAACSRSKGSPVPARHSASSQGMEMLADTLQGIGVRATVFAESEALADLPDPGCLRGLEVACHGVEHEDLTGESTGLVFEDQDLRNIIRRSKEDVGRTMGVEPHGFRAPYLNIDPRVLRHVAEAGFTYDSSITRPVEDGRLLPWRLPEGLWEFPLARDTDSQGRVMDSYLWAMHEGRRPEADYLGMVDRFQEGVLVMATHSWHLMESVRGGPKGRAQAESEAESIAVIIGHAVDDGYLVMSLDRVEDMLNEDR